MGLGFLGVLGRGLGHGSLELGTLWLLVGVWDLRPRDGGPGASWELGAWAWTCGWGPEPWEWGNLGGSGFWGLRGIGVGAGSS